MSSVLLEITATNIPKLVDATPHHGSCLVSHRTLAALFAFAAPRTHNTEIPQTRGNIQRFDGWWFTTRPQQCALSAS